LILKELSLKGDKVTRVGALVVVEDEDVRAVGIATDRVVPDGFEAQVGLLWGRHLNAAICRAVVGITSDDRGQEKLKKAIAGGGLVVIGVPRVDGKVVAPSPHAWVGVAHIKALVTVVDVLRCGVAGSVKEKPFIDRAIVVLQEHCLAVENVTPPQEAVLDSLYFPDVAGVHGLSKAPSHSLPLRRAVWNVKELQGLSLGSPLLREGDLA